MNLYVKRFSELTTLDLFEILKLRCAVFIVEQNCPYQDVDDLDKSSMHVYYEENGEILAYLRVFQLNENTCRIGRVISKYRKQGLGLKVLKAGIEAVNKYYDVAKIDIEAQCYAVEFYEKVGFKAYGDSFLEDGIPHIHMALELAEVL